MNVSLFSKRGAIPGFTYGAWDALVYSGIIVEESGGYRMAYTGYEADGQTYGPCIATSTDLVNWIKPNIGEITYDGDTDNNIVIGYSDIIMHDMAILNGEYVMLVANISGNNTSLVYMSPDGVTWTFAKTVFSDATHGAHIESKAIIFVDGVYRIYYNQDHTTERRSIGYYESATLAGTWVDQGLISEWTSTASNLQFYDLKVIYSGDEHWASVAVFDKVTELLGPHRLYRSTDNGVSWERRNDIIELGDSGTFDDGLLAVGKPLKVAGHWHYMYVGGDRPHNIWPKGMLFATARADLLDVTLGDTTTKFWARYDRHKSLLPAVGPDGSCVRASTAGYYDGHGVWQYAQDDIEAVTHDPATRSVRGLSVFDARTNQLTDPQSMGSVNWTLSHATIDDNAAAFIDDTTVMDRLNVATTDERHRVFQRLTLTAGVQIEAAVFFKDDGGRYVGLSLLGTADSFVTVVADLASGVITQESEGATDGTITEAALEDHGDGVYKLTMIASVGTADPFFIVQTQSGPTPTLNTSGSELFQGVEGDDVFICGAYAAGSAFTTPYAPSDHQADAIAYEDVSWYNASQGSFYIEVLPTDISGDRGILALTAGDTGADGLTLWFDEPEGTVTAFLGTSTGNDGLIQVAAAVANTRTRIALSYENNSMKMYVNGVAGTPDVSVTLPPTNTPDNMKVGNLAPGNVELNGYVRELRYYDQVLNSDQLAILTEPREGSSVVVGVGLKYF